MSRKRFLCMDCSIDTGKAGEHYMLLDEIWNQVCSSPLGMLCVRCLERRLGRRLTKNDFNNSYINSMNFAPKSAVLSSRLTGEPLEAGDDVLSPS